MFSEITTACYSLDDWQRLLARHPFLKDQNYIPELANSIRLTGFVDPLHGLIRPDQMSPHNRNYREGFTARGSNSRYRAVLLHIINHVLTFGRCSTIYLAEALSPFAEMLGKSFPYLTKSEYIANPRMRWRLPHLRHEDPLRLSLPDRAFDIYVAPDTMIYAANMESFLLEARRVLRRTGVLLATFPFRYGEQASDVKAELVNGEIVHHGDPEYHSDPIDSEQGRLIFFVPGWNILAAARDCGFQSAEIVVHSSRTNAILGTEIAAVFVLKAMA
jgi:SAM-dependent methyltransferase